MSFAADQHAFAFREVLALRYWDDLHLLDAQRAHSLDLMFLACPGHAAAQHQHLGWYVRVSVGSDSIHNSRLLLGEGMVSH